MNYFHIAALSAGASITKNPCKLHSVTINTKGITSNLLTLYDNNAGDSSGNVIAAIDTTANVGHLIYDVDTRAGLSYVLAAGTAADVTVSYA